MKRCADCSLALKFHISFIFIQMAIFKDGKRQRAENDAFLTFISYLKSMSAYCKVTGKPQ